jgi:glycosyltransferase involved in cell wall biosynthesis
LWFLHGSQLHAPLSTFSILKIILTIGGLSAKYGGPSQTLPAYATALANAGLEVGLISCGSSGSDRPVELSSKVELTVLPLHNRQTRWLPAQNDFFRTIRSICRGRGDCLIHDQGAWLPINHAAAYAGRMMKIPRLVTSHGMLSSWAMRFKGLKKWMAWRLYQRRDLQSAQVLHATSLAEMRDFRAAGLTQPVAVIPNGVFLPPRSPNSEIGTRKSETRTVLFLGRIHPVKGLINLVQAWAGIQRSEAGGRRPAVAGQSKWRVIIAGGDENGHLNEVKAESRKQNVENDFEFVGPVEGEAKWDLYRSADLFVLPSHSENFGLVVAEALACGVPVIASRGTPWEDLITHRCGWWVDNQPEALADALRNAVNRTDEDRREMGRRGRELVGRKYSWPGIAAQMKPVYEWMLGEGRKPEWVL